MHAALPLPLVPLVQLADVESSVGEQQRCASVWAKQAHTKISSGSMSQCVPHRVEGFTRSAETVRLVSLADLTAVAAAQQPQQRALVWSREGVDWHPDTAKKSSTRGSTESASAQVTAKRRMR